MLRFRACANVVCGSGSATHNKAHLLAPRACNITGPLDYARKRATRLVWGTLRSPESSKYISWVNHNDRVKPNSFDGRFETDESDV